MLLRTLFKTLALHLDLATDCLRLSMHFFHPIQQCAQQVYYTALPLSPTSSYLRDSCLQSVADDHLSHVIAFSGAPDTWGLLLRTINIRPRQLTCIATSAQRIVAACEDIVDIYDAVTLVVQHSIRAPETVTKILGSLDGSALFFAHSYSVTMWDVQTGGLTHSFTTQCEVTDIGISTTGDHIACGSSDGPVAFWNIRTKEEGKSFGNGQTVVAIHWISPQKLAVGTHGSVYTHNIATGTSLKYFSIFGRLRGMVYSPRGEGEFLVGISQPGEGANEEQFSLEIIKKIEGLPWKLSRRTTVEQPLRMDIGLLHPTLVGGEIACITPQNGVQFLDARSYNWTNNPPLLDAATSVAVSLNRNLVAQTKDSIQIFSLDVLKTGGARNYIRPSHVYPLGERYIVCLLQPTRRLTLLELETLRELRPDNNTSPLQSLFDIQSPSARASFSHGFVAELGVSVVIQAWQSGTPLPEWTEAADDSDLPLSRLSPDRTRIVTLYGSPRRGLRVEDAKDGSVLANLLRGDDDMEMGEVYDVTFASQTRFHLKIDGQEWHVQVPYDVTPTPSGPHSHTITKGEPVPLSEPRATPPYTLDANCEWVVDAGSRKICWISPGDVRRGNGGHFWAGLSLVMVGDDGVVRKLSFREPDS
jgi:WD40 repeat protein